MTVAEIRSALRCGQSLCMCRRGRAVHCPAHGDRTPSLGVDERAGRILVHCRAGCPQEDVLAALQRLGLWRATTRTNSAPALPHESPLDAARRQVLEAARRQPWAQEGVQILYELSDWIRLSRRKVTALRGLAASAEDFDTALIPLVRAARIETLVAAVEDEIDVILGEGRVA